MESGDTLPFMFKIDWSGLRLGKAALTTANFVCIFTADRAIKKPFYTVKLETIMYRYKVKKGFNIIWRGVGQK